MVDIARDLGGAAGEVAHARRELRRAAHRDLIDLDGQQRQLLAEIVVQVAGDALTLRLLGRDETPGEILDALVADAKRLTGPSKRLLGTPACGHIAPCRLDFDYLPV